MTTIYDYFLAAFGPDQPLDPSYHELPIDSVCGADCKKAIDAGKALAAAVDPSVRWEVIDVVTHACNVCWFG